MHNPFAPLIAIAQRGHSLSASHGPAPGPRPLAPVLPPTLAGVRIQLKYRHLRKAPVSSGSVTVRVTHLAKKCLPMRHKIPTHPHNPLK